MVLLFPTLKSISSDKCNKYKIEYKLTFKLCKILSFLFSMHRKKKLAEKEIFTFSIIYIRVCDNVRTHI